MFKFSVRKANARSELFKVKWSFMQSRPSQRFDEIVAWEKPLENIAAL